MSMFGMVGSVGGQGGKPPIEWYLDATKSNAVEAEFTDITGGWTLGSRVMESNYISKNLPNYYTIRTDIGSFGSTAVMNTVKKIDLSDIKTLVVKWYVSKLDNALDYIFLGVANSYKEGPSSGVDIAKLKRVSRNPINSFVTQTLDVSNFTGEYYLRLGAETMQNYSIIVVSKLYGIR